MSARESATRNNRIWLLLAVLCLAGVAATFLLGPERREMLFLRVWSLRFAGAGAFFLCLGMGLRNAVLKSLMFSTLAVFAALGAGEWYLSRMDATAAAAVVAAAPRLESEDSVFMVEFAEELMHRNDAPVELATDPSKLPTRYITERNELIKYKSTVGVPDPAGFMSYAEEFTDDPVLGYRAIRKAARIAAVKLLGNHIVYDATYTLLPTGWRYVPQNPGATEAVVFFGCSFTFGEGLNDDETYAYKVAERLGPNYQVFNFGFHGYGSHQMLAMIENGYLDDIAARYDKVHVVFMTIAGHELRSAGKSSWDKNGPCYELTDEGVVHVGTFSERGAGGGFQLPIVARVGEQQRMENLHLAIMRRADDILREKYRSRLNVVAWFGVPYVHRLREEGLRTLDITRMAGERFTIKYDGHPNDYATTEAAKRITPFILEETET